MAKPFVKWAGGKRQLLSQIVEKLPQGFGEGTFRKYAEPFVGGGALLFHLFKHNLIDEAYISDNNPEIINVYLTIKNDVEGLIKQLQILQDEYDSAKDNPEERRIDYFEHRDEFNDMNLRMLENETTKRAAYFIYLNKTGFNGLFRVNKRGGFNVPPSSLKDKTFLDENNLKEVSRVLQNVKIHHGDFQACESWVDSNTFVYFDPPYRPLTKTSFTTYSSHSWNDDKEQIRLANFVKKLAKGLKLMISNSNPEDVNDGDLFFAEQFPDNQGFFRTPVQAIRSINSKGDGRGQVSELIITNYKIR